MSQERLDHALRYHKMGLSIIPVSKNKQPLCKWGQYQHQQASMAKILEWWGGQNDSNIALVCGHVSNVLCLDCDGQDAIKAIKKIIPPGLILPMATTPRGGMHFFFQHADGFISRREAQDLDCKDEGGYVILAPSIHENGKRWEWLPGRSILDVPPPIMPEDFRLNLRKLFSNQLLTSKEASNLHLSTSRDLNHFLEEGSRNEDLFSVANHLLRGYADETMVRKVLEILYRYGNKNSSHPITAYELESTIQSALKRAAGREINLANEVRQWIEVCEGNFNLRDIERDMKLDDTQRKNLWIIINRMVAQGTIEKVGMVRGIYRTKQQKFDKLDITQPMQDPLDLQWPFKIQKHFLCFPGNIAVLAGSANVGKTAFCLDFARLNKDNFEVHYFSSEMGTTELQSRLRLFDIPYQDWHKITFWDVHRNWQDAIKPDLINVIDFMEIYEDFWKAGHMINQIHLALKKGMALIALQRKGRVEIAKGGEQTLEKPRLYLTMSKDDASVIHTIKILKAKNWADPETNPNGISLDFEIERGNKFKPLTMWGRFYGTG